MVLGQRRDVRWCWYLTKPRVKLQVQAQVQAQVGGLAAKAVWGPGCTWLARLGWQDGGWGSGRAGLPPEEFLGARSPASTHWGTWGTWGPAIT